jgi:hypothetical protein
VQQKGIKRVYRSAYFVPESYFNEEAKDNPPEGLIGGENDVEGVVFANGDLDAEDPVECIEEGDLVINSIANLLGHVRIWLGIHSL